MTRVLHAMAGAKHGGAEAFFFRLVRGLNDAGETQRVLMRHAAPAATLRRAGIPVDEAPFGSRWLDLVTRLRFRRAIRGFRPRIVLTWMTRATQLCPAGDFVHVARLGGYYDLRHYAGCDHLIGNTRDLVDTFIRQGWPRARAHYVPNFVDAPEATPVPRATLATPDDAPLALALGRLHPNKAFDTLIAALPLVPRLHLWIAGEGPLQGELAAQIGSLGLGDRVRLLGWRDDVASLLAACDFLVCPSRHEPLGNVVIEAWGARRAVVAAASVGPAALIEDGTTGLLVPVDEPEAMAAALGRLVEEPELRARLAAGGQARYQAEFTEAQVVSRYRDLFARLAR